MTTDVEPSVGYLLKIVIFFRTKGGIAPNQVIARSEFEVHRQIYME